MTRHEVVCEAINGTITHCSINMGELWWPDMFALGVVLAFVFWLLIV